jgi:hypothetical protein
MPKSEFPVEEIARRGDEIYDHSIRVEVEGKYDGQVVAIDVDTGRYALGETAWAAAEPLLSQSPDAQIWLVRVGERAFHHFGYWKKRDREATVNWDGAPRDVEVDAADTDPLVGMALLAGHELRIKVIAGGTVTVSAIP